MRNEARETLFRHGSGCVLAALLLCACTPTEAPFVTRVSETVPTPAGTAASAAGDTGGAVTTPVRDPVTESPNTVALQGISEVPRRPSRGDYRRAAFGNTWTDDHDAPGGHNNCDTRNDILDRDLVDKTYKSISSCPNAVATGILHDPYTNRVITFIRGAQTGAAVQIDHIVPLAYAWDMGASSWTDGVRVRFANDPANLLAVQGDSNQSKGDREPAEWMPPNAAFDCQYASRFARVLLAYGLSIDIASAAVVATAVATCPST